MAVTAPVAAFLWHINIGTQYVFQLSHNTLIIHSRMQAELKTKMATLR
jgi:hypothetical protein